MNCWHDTDSGKKEEEKKKKKILKIYDKLDTGLKKQKIIISSKLIKSHKNNHMDTYPALFLLC